MPNETRNDQGPHRLTAGRRGQRLIVVGAVVVVAFAAAYHFWGRNQYLAYRLNNLIQQVRISEAVGLANELGDSPESAEVCLLVVQANRLSGDLQTADRLLVKYESVIQAPQRIASERTLNRARRGQLGGVDNQLAALLRDPDLDSRDVSEAFTIGFRLNRRLEEAAMLLEAWKQDWPSDYRPHYHEGLMRQTLTNWKLAVTSYRTAIKLAPKAFDCRVHLGQCLSQMQKEPEAAEQFKFVVDRDPTNEAALLGLSNSLKEQGEFGSARQAYMNLLEVNSGSFAARLAVAQIDFAQDEVDLAYEAVMDLSKIWPNDVATLYLLSQTQAAKRDTAASKDTLKLWTEADKVVQQIETDIQALAAKPDDLDLQVSIGARMVQHYSREMGHQFLVAALQIRPDHSIAAKALQDYSKRQTQITAMPLPTPKASQ